MRRFRVTFQDGEIVIQSTMRPGDEVWWKVDFVEENTHGYINTNQIQFVEELS